LAEAANLDLDSLEATGAFDLIRVRIATTTQEQILIRKVLSGS